MQPNLQEARQKRENRFADGSRVTEHPKRTEQRKNSEQRSLPVPRSDCRRQAQQQASQTAVEVEQRGVPGLGITGQIENTVVVGRHQGHETGQREAAARAEPFTAVLCHAQPGQLGRGDELHGGQEKGADP